MDFTKRKHTSLIINTMSSSITIENREVALSRKIMRNRDHLYASDVTRHVARAVIRQLTGRCMPVVEIGVKEPFAPSLATINASLERKLKNDSALAIVIACRHDDSEPGVVITPKFNDFRSSTLGKYTQKSFAEESIWADFEVPGNTVDADKRIGINSIPTLTIDLANINNANDFATCKSKLKTTSIANAIVHAIRLYNNKTPVLRQPKKTNSSSFDEQKEILC